MRTTSTRSTKTRTISKREEREKEWKYAHNNNNKSDWIQVERMKARTHTHTHMTAADFEVCRVTFFKILQVAGLRSSLVAVVVAHSSCGLLPRPSGLVKRCCLYLAFILIYRNAFFFIYFFSFSGKVLWVMKFFSFCLCLCICKLFFFFYFYHLPAHCRFAKKLLLSDLPTVFFFVVVVEVVCNRCTLIFFFFFSLSYSGFVIAETKERLHKSRKRKKKKRKSSHA